MQIRMRGNNGRITCHLFLFLSSSDRVESLQLRVLGAVNPLPVIHHGSRSNVGCFTGIYRVFTGLSTHHLEMDRSCLPRERKRSIPHKRSIHINLNNLLNGEKLMKVFIEPLDPVEPFYFLSGCCNTCR